MRVRWLRKALANLHAEASYISLDDSDAARLVVARIMTAVSRLSQLPMLGRPGRVPGTRELIVPRTRYLVPYRVRGNVVEILRVFDVSRRLPQKW
jgi:plasmid stabilization system protein ParE